MSASLVRCRKFRKVVAAVMSEYVEIIYPQSMTAKLLHNGEVVSEYKIEQCDKCSKLTKFDPFGFQIGYDRTEKVIWFCAVCR